MKRKEKQQDPWTLVREGRLKDITDWLHGNIAPMTSFNINSVEKESGQTLLATAIDAVPTPIRTGVQEDMAFVYTIRLLCEAYEADLSFPCGEKKHTAAHRAVLKKNIDVLRYIVCNRQSPFCKDIDGLDPYSLAKKLGYTDGVKLLEKEMEKRGLQPSLLPTKSTANVREGKLPNDSVMSSLRSPTLARDRSQRTPRKNMPSIKNADNGSRDMESSLERRWKANDRGLAQKVSSTASALDSSRFQRSHSSENLSPLSLAGRCPLSKVRTFITTLCSPKSLPALIQQESSEFIKLCGTTTDISFFQIRDMFVNRKPIGYLLRFRGLIPYIIRGNTYHAPTVVLAYYPKAIYEKEDANYAVSPSSILSGRIGAPSKSPPAEGKGNSIRSSFTQLYNFSSSENDYRSYFYPRFRTFLDKNNLSKYCLNARASIYLDPFSGAFLPSASDHMFASLALYVKYGVIRCFEAIPPMVVSESSASLPECVPLSVRNAWEMIRVGSTVTKKDNSSCLPFIFYPVLRMFFHPVTNYSSSLPVTLKSRSGVPVLETYLYPHPYPEKICFLSPLTGKQLRPCKSLVDEHEGKPIPPPPLSLLLPFTFARYPCWTPSCDVGDNSFIEQHHYPASGGSQYREVLEHQLGASSFDILRSFQIYQDLSYFADGMLTYNPENQTIEGFLPIVGTRPMSVLVNRIDNLEDFALTALGSAIRRAGYDTLTTARSHPSFGTSPPSTNTLVGNRMNTVVKNVSTFRRTSLTKTTPVFHLEVENVERLCNIKVRIEFKNNMPSGSPLTTKGPGCCDLSPFDFPPRIFFPDAAHSSTFSSSSANLTKKCFETVLLNSQTGELNPVFVLIPPSEETEEGLASESSMSSALALPRRDRGSAGSAKKIGMLSRNSAPTTNYIRLLDPAKWREQSRPLLTLLAALRDLVTQLLKHMSTRTGDDALVKPQNAAAKGPNEGDVRSNLVASKNTSSLDTFFLGNASNDEGKKSGEAKNSTTATAKNSGDLCPPSESTIQGKCIFCLSGSKEVVYKPCYHLASCKKCAAEHCLLELKATNQYLVSNVSAASSSTENQSQGCDLKESLSSWRCELCMKPIAGLCEVYL